MANYTKIDVENYRKKDWSAPTTKNTLFFNFEVKIKNLKTWTHKLFEHLNLNITFCQVLHQKLPEVTTLMSAFDGAATAFY